MQTADRLVAWLLETLCIAIGTSLFMGVLELTHDWKSSLEPHNPLLALAGFLVLVPIVIFYFGLTGYLFTTAYAAVKLRTKAKWLYPSTAAILYIIHSQVLFLGMGNTLISRNTIISVGGACIAFGCGLCGNRLILWRSGHIERSSTEPFVLPLT